ncbi:hypothetical protein ABZ891_19895 [Streptomyces sp. NPDC047023]
MDAQWNLWRRFCRVVDCWLVKARWWTGSLLKILPGAVGSD